jgi:hypothetical protein
MLRARKIMAYVAEHLQPPFLSKSYVPVIGEGEEPPKVEEWLELLSHDQVFLPSFLSPSLSSLLFPILVSNWIG